MNMCTLSIHGKRKTSFLPTLGSNHNNKNNNGQAGARWWRLCFGSKWQMGHRTLAWRCRTTQGKSGPSIGKHGTEAERHWQLPRWMLMLLLMVLLTLLPAACRLPPVFCRLLSDAWHSNRTYADAFKLKVYLNFLGFVCALPHAHTQTQGYKHERIRIIKICCIKYAA